MGPQLIPVESSFLVPNGTFFVELAAVVPAVGGVIWWLVRAWRPH